MMKQESGEITTVTTPKRRRRQADTPTSTVSKPDSPDSFTEQLQQQSSAARILQELPRYNWLEQKILQRNAYNNSPGSAGSNSPNANSVQQTRQPNVSSNSRNPMSSGMHTKTKSSESLVADYPVESRTTGKQRHSSTARDDDGESDFSSRRVSEGELTYSCQSMPELVPVVSTCNGVEMSTLKDPPVTEPSEMTSVPVKLEVTMLSTEEETGFEISIPSPDDGADENGLTIDLSDADDGASCHSNDETDIFKDVVEGDAVVKMETDTGDASDSGGLAECSDKEKETQNDEQPPLTDATISECGTSSATTFTTTNTTTTTTATATMQENQESCSLFSMPIITTDTDNAENLLGKTDSAENLLMKSDSAENPLVKMECDTEVPAVPASSSPSSSPPSSSSSLLKTSSNTEMSSIAMDESDTHVPSLVTITTTVETNSPNNTMKSENISVTASSPMTSFANDIMPVHTQSGDNSNMDSDKKDNPDQDKSYSSCSAQSGHDTKCSGYSILQNSVSKTTNAATLSVATTTQPLTASSNTSTAATTTQPLTASSTTPTAATTATSSSRFTATTEGDIFAPLDLCVKRTESLTSTSGRAKGNPPVQMVLPTVQPKVSTSTSQTVNMTSSQISVDSKALSKSAVTSLQTPEGLDSNQTCMSGDGILSSKSHHLTSLPSLGTEFKVERCYPLHTDSVDICKKTSGMIWSTSTDSPAHQGHHHGNEGSEGSAIDESITIGLALSAELETETDRDRSGRRSGNDAIMPGDKQSSETTNSDIITSHSDLIDMSMSSSTFQTSKSMTDAELDQEFQKHLIEFKALEKLAERKAQEQMQVAIMKKRKAEMLRIMEIKKAKRDLGKVGHTESIFADSEKSTAASSPNVALTSTATTTTMTICSVSVPFSTITRSPITTTVAIGHGVSTLPFSDSITKLSSSLATDHQMPSVDLSQAKHSSMIAQNTSAANETHPQVMSPVHIKTEVMDVDESETVIDSDAHESVFTKLELKTEIMDTETSDVSENLSTNLTSQVSSQPLNASPSSSNEHTSNSVKVDVISDNGLSTTATTTNSSSDKPEVGQDHKPGSASPPNPLPAHQTPPMTLPLDKSEPSPASTSYIQGPYHRRNVAVLEPPYVGKETNPVEVPQKAHNQRPFQTAGNLIVPVAGVFSSTTESQSVPAKTTGRPPVPVSSSSSSSSSNSIVTVRSQPNYVQVAPRPTIGESCSGGVNKTPRHTEGVEPSSKMAAPLPNEVLLARNLRKSLDEAEFRELKRTGPKPVMDSGPKSADDVSKPHPQGQGFSPVTDKRCFPRPPHASLPCLEKPPNLQQMRQVHPPQPPLLTPAGRHDERPSYIPEELRDKHMFRGNPRPPLNNQVVDLTRDGHSAGSEQPQCYSLQSPPLHAPICIDGPVQYSRLEAMVRRQPPVPSGTSKQGPPGGGSPPPLFTDYHTLQDKTSALPNGFNNDRSRPGGFITNKHRLPMREPARPVPVKEPPFFKDHIRPSMSSVTQHRQRYLTSNAGDVADAQMTLSSQAALASGFPKPPEDMSPRFPPPSAHMPWPEEQGGVGAAEFLAANSSRGWRGPSPGGSSRPGPGKDMYSDADPGSRMMVEEMDKHRSRPDVHPAFHRPSDIIYKQQKHLEMEMLMGFPGQGMGVNTSHPSTLPLSSIVANSTSTRPMISQPILQRPSHPRQLPVYDSLARHQAQQHQKPVRHHQPLEMGPSPWRSYGSVDAFNMAAASSQARPPYAPNHPSPVGQSMSSLQQEALAYQKMQQQQIQQHQQMHQQQQQQQQQQQHQYQLHQMQHGRSPQITQKPVATPPGSSPNQRLASGPPQSHAGQSLAPPQLMFGECSRSPSHPNMSPTAMQNAAMMLPQNRNLHHPRPSEADHIAVMHPHRPQPKHPLYDQRSRAAPLPPQPLPPQPGLPPSTAPVPGMSGPPRPDGGYSSLGGAPAPGTMGSSTNSLCRVCGKVAVFLCSSCRRVWYCNQQCQTKHWAVHSAECKPVS